MTYLYKGKSGGFNIAVEYCFSSFDNCIKIIEMYVDGKYHRANWMSKQGLSDLMSNLENHFAINVKAEHLN